MIQLGIGVTSWTALVDTGATVSVLSERILEETAYEKGVNWHIDHDQIYFALKTAAGNSIPVLYTATTIIKLGENYLIAKFHVVEKMYNEAICPIVLGRDFLQA